MTETLEAENKQLRRLLLHAFESGNVRATAERGCIQCLAITAYVEEALAERKHQRVPVTAEDDQ